jgi:hypothetical protein
MCRRVRDAAAGARFADRHVVSHNTKPKLSTMRGFCDLSIGRGEVQVQSQCRHVQEEAETTVRRTVRALYLLRVGQPPCALFATPAKRCGTRDGRCDRWRPQSESMPCARKLRGMVTKKNIALKTVALVVILGIPALLFFGFVYAILSPREWAIGLIAWFASLLIWTMVSKLATKNTLAPSAETAIALDDRARKRILRRIWIGRLWISLLIVSLPFGIANGVSHRAWLPTLVGVGIDVLLMYVAIREIRQLQHREHHEQH